jgi:hypothetical protein
LNKLDQELRVKASTEFIKYLFLLIMAKHPDRWDLGKDLSQRMAAA